VDTSAGAEITPLSRWSISGRHTNLGGRSRCSLPMCNRKDVRHPFSGFANGNSPIQQRKFVSLAASADCLDLVISMAETDEGKVWMGTREQGLYYL